MIASHQWRQSIGWIELKESRDETSTCLLARGLKRSYDAAFKLAAVEDAEKKQLNRAAARKLMVDEWI